MSCKILVVEDDPTSLQLMTLLFTAFGHAWLPANDGEEGLEIARREMPDIIVCDLQLPKMNGFELARCLKSHPGLQTIPLVAVTAFAMVGDRDKVLRAGFDGYIPKPIDPQTFVAEVCKFAHKARGSDPRPPATPEASKPARATVLVVDDSQVNVSLARSILEPNGYRVLEARTAEQALELARANSPDLILSDLHLRGPDGYALISAVKDDPQLSLIPFVFISATIWREQDRRDGLALGATKFILRPIESAQLLAELEEVLKE